MTHTEDQKKNDEDQPPGIIEDGEHREQRDGRGEYPFGFVPENGIDDMAAVELPHGKEVKGRNEKAYPACVRKGMEYEIEAFWYFPDEYFLEYLEKQGIAKLEEGHILDDELNRRELDAEHNERQGYDETREGPGNADIEKGILVDYDPFHLDDGAEGAERRQGKGDKIGEGRRDAVSPAHKVVTHLMGEKNGHNGKTIGAASYEPC